MSLQALLRKHGFARNPFDSWIAEDERELANWFVAPRFLDTLLGLEHASGRIGPSSAVVLGEPGIGKTAIRRTMESRLHSLSPDTLLIPYTDFTKPLSIASDATPTLAAHVDELILLASVGLIGLWSEDSTRYERLDLSQQAELAGLVYQYFAELPPEEAEKYVSELSPRVGRVTQAMREHGKKLVETYNAVISVINKEQIEPADWGRGVRSEDGPYLRLKRLWRLAKAMGVADIRVLIDRIDEAAAIRTPQDILQCVSELLLSQQFMEFRDGDTRVMGVTVFLSHPEEVRQALEDANFRRDRIPVERISWERADLTRALVRRLDYFSSGRIGSFSDLCDESVKDAQAQILDSCDLRPRTLFRICAEIQKAFQRSGRSGTHFNLTDVQQGITAGRAAQFG